jgi:DNA-binding transcriptional regulator YdaS (Cro superfamily)
MDAKSALDTAIKAAGSASAIARHLGITPQAVLQWRTVPADKVLEVEKISGVSRHLLRPDVFGPLPDAPVAAE